MDPFVERPSLYSKPQKLEAFLRTNSAGIPYTLLLGIEAIEFPTICLLPYSYKRLAVTAEYILNPQSELNNPQPILEPAQRK